MPLSTIQMLLTFFGSIVMPVGDELAASIVHEPNSVPDVEYLKTLSVVLLSVTQTLVPSDEFLLLVFRAKLDATACDPDRRLAALA